MIDHHCLPPPHILYLVIILCLGLITCSEIVFHFLISEPFPFVDIAILSSVDPPHQIAIVSKYKGIRHIHSDPSVQIISHIPVVPQSHHFIKVDQRK